MWNYQETQQFHSGLSAQEKTDPHKNLYTNVHSGNSQQSKGRNSPNVHPLINKMCFIHVVEYYSAIKRAEVLIHATMWVNLENMWRDRSQAQLTPYGVVPFLQNVEYMHPQTGDLWLPGPGGGRWPEGVSFGGWQECSGLESEDSCTTL